MSEPVKVCRRHRWDGVLDQTLLGPHESLLTRVTLGRRTCSKCGRVQDEARSRRGRTSRTRGNRAELTVARKVGGTKVGPLGQAWDVETGTMRLQVKKVSAWPSMNAVLAYMDAIPKDILRMRGVVLTEPGRSPREVIVLDFREFCEWYGDPTKTEVQP